MSQRGITRQSAELYAVAGPMTLATVTGLQRAGYRAFADAAASFDIDLGNVDGVDSAGLALLIDWLAWAATHQRLLGYRNAPPALQSLAVLSEVREILLPAALPS
jgi:phospholipid transport system transporter-binding protein